MLDAFEGEGCTRVAVTVRVVGKQPIEAFVYALKREQRVPVENLKLLSPKME